MAIKKIFITVLIIILFIISSVVFYFIIRSSNYGTISGIVTKRLEPGVTGEIGFENVYAKATVEIYALKQETVDGQTMNVVDKLVKKVRTDKDGEFSVKVPAGKYQIRSFYGEKLKSNDVNVEVKMARTSRVEIQLQEL
jgi:hypothetical protein